MVRPRDWRTAGETFRFRGRRIFYRAEGSGDPLLLIHGFPTASWDWHRIWPTLVGRFRVVAPDLLGFGFSAKPTDHEYSIFEQADLCEALLAERGIHEPVHVLSHDYGDTVAQELIARGASLRSVLLLNGGIFPEEIRRRRIQKLIEGPFGGLIARLMTEGRFRKSFVPIFGPDTRPTEEELSAFWGLITMNGGKRVAHRLSRYQEERGEHRDRWVGGLLASPVPVRLVIGPADPISGVRMADRYRELHPDPDVVLLEERIGHYPQLEDPEGVLSAFLEFVEES